MCLVATLDRLPRTPATSYGNCLEASFATLVGTTNDPCAWRALERAARRADPGLRMEMLFQTDYAEAKLKCRLPRLALLALFLDDSAVRDTTTNIEKWDAIYAGIRFPRLEVRNFAAWEMARILDSPADPNTEWTEADWVKLRDQMRAAAKREPGEQGKDSAPKPR
jgi:hypothetical protein